MISRKLIVTHRGRLTAKYGLEGANAIDLAVRELVSADDARGIKSFYVHLDDAGEMKVFDSKAVSRNPSASSCKKVIDKALVAKVSFDYLVLLGSDDVIPHFRVANPSFAEEADTDHEVLTDNPYAASVAFKADSRATYLVPDRVVGRIPDVPGSTDPAWLLNYLRSAAELHPLDLSELTLDLLVCCDTWKNSGSACVGSLARKLADLLLSPPTIDTTADLAHRYPARLQMIKCHGAPLDPTFYGQDGEVFPEVLRSSLLQSHTSAGTVVGAMCCFGAAVYDPAHIGAVEPGTPAIANVYLRQGAAGFLGSTCISWVGVDQMACADLIVIQFLRNVLKGASLGAALLDSKQRFLADINKEGRMPDAAEEKTLLQFILLADASLCPILPPDEHLAAMVPAETETVVGGTDTNAFGSAGKDYRFQLRRAPAMAAERRSRRAFHFRMAHELRDMVPERTVAEPRANSSTLLTTEELAQFGDIQPVVHRVTRALAKTERTRRRPVAQSAGTMFAPGLSFDDTVSLTFREETLQYYWFARTERHRVIDAIEVKVETDLDGNVLRKRKLVTA